jgi:hypothetical protein
MLSIGLIGTEFSGVDFGDVLCPPAELGVSIPPPLEGDELLRNILNRENRLVEVAGLRCVGGGDGDGECSGDCDPGDWSRKV